MMISLIKSNFFYYLERGEGKNADVLLERRKGGREIKKD
jgi:hypothetical protein